MRADRPEPAILLSVVIAATDSADAVKACVKSLGPVLDPPGNLPGWHARVPVSMSSIAAQGHPHGLVSQSSVAAACSRGREHGTRSAAFTGWRGGEHAAADAVAAGMPKVEILVVFDPGRIDADRLPDGPRYLAGPAGADAHELRRLGLDEAKGRIVAFTEDSCRFASGWAASWLEAFETPDLVAATGPVEPSRLATVLDDAVFLCEYAPFLGTSASGPRTPRRLAGNNFASRIGELPRGSRSIDETDVMAFVRGRGGRVANLADCGVVHARGYSLAEAIRDRLRFGLQFGRSRAARWSSWERGIRVALGPVALASQLLRLAATLARSRRMGGALIDAGPLAAALLAAWTVGEWLGWLLGGAVANEVEHRPDPPRDRPAKGRS